MAMLLLMVGHLFQLTGCTERFKQVIWLLSFAGMFLFIWSPWLIKYVLQYWVSQPVAKATAIGVCSFLANTPYAHRLPQKASTAFYIPHIAEKEKTYLSAMR